MSPDPKPSTPKPPAGAAKPLEFSEVVPTGEAASPTMTRKVKLRAMTVADTKDSPPSEMSMGDLLTIGARLAGIVGDPRTALRGLHAREVDPLISAVEDSLEAYHQAAEKQREALAAEGFKFEGARSIELEAPVQFGKEEVRELVLDPLKVEHLWETTTSRALTLFETAQVAGKQAGVSSGVIDRLEMADAGTVNATVTGFLAAFRKTGG